MPSAAEVYAAAIAAETANVAVVQATRPAGWVSPAGTCTVTDAGLPQLTTANGAVFLLNPAILLSLADWAIATFRTQV